MGAIVNAIKYELATNLQALKKFDTWIFLCTVIAIILFLYKEFVWAIIALIIVLVLDAARSHATGQVTEYFRKKYKNQFKDEQPK